VTKDQNSQIQDQEEVSDVEQSKATTLNSSDDQNIQNNDADSEYGEEEYNIDDVDLDTGDTAVAATSTSKVISIIVVSLAVVVFLYVMFVPSEEDKLKETEDEIKVYDKARESAEAPVFRVAKAVEEEMEPIIEDISPSEQVVSQVIELEIPDLPDLDVASIPSENNFVLEPTFSDDNLFAKSSAEDVVSESSDEDILLNEQMSAGEKNENINIKDDTLPDMQVGGPNADPNPGQVRTPMLLMNGGGVSIVEESELLDSSSEMITATKIANAKRAIVEGKLIDSVLETAINTDFEGKVRAIVSRDVYSDFSNAVLIPKGSRVIGSYAGNVTTGQTRVLINWERLIRPDAVDILINSPTSDQFGRSGVAGNVDNKYLELFNNSILLSLITIGAAMAIEESTNTSGVTTEEDSEGDTTTTSTPSAIAAEEIINNISSTAETVLTGVLSTNPTITVPHGTRIKIFVNQDLFFPETASDSSSNSGVIFVK
jgi:type IV secretion system protein VirB10